MKLSLKVKDEFDIEVAGGRYGVNLIISGEYDTTETSLDQQELKALISLLEQFKEEE